MFPFCTTRCHRFFYTIIACGNCGISFYYLPQISHLEKSQQIRAFFNTLIAQCRSVGDFRAIVLRVRMCGEASFCTFSHTHAFKFICAISSHISHSPTFLMNIHTHFVKCQNGRSSNDKLESLPSTPVRSSSSPLLGSFNHTQSAICRSSVPILFDLVKPFPFPLVSIRPRDRR